MQHKNFNMKNTNLKVCKEIHPMFDNASNLWGNTLVNLMFIVYMLGMLTSFKYIVVFPVFGMQ